MKEKTKRVTLTMRDIYLIYSVFYRNLEFLGGDDRPDHGLAQLKQIYDNPELHKDLARIMGRFYRLRLFYSVKT
jgi:hypothetical protein